MAALHIAKSKKPYSIGEKLLKPCMIDICTELFSNEHVTKIKKIPMSNDIENQLSEKIKKSIFYAIQLDESTDINNEDMIDVCEVCRY